MRSLMITADNHAIKNHAQESCEEQKGHLCVRL
jgi:hypothetical protein